jgi:transcriptional regulator with XRE-family HTH domain
MDHGVGQVVKRLREERGWSQTKLAVEANMSVGGVSLIENGRRNLSTATLAKLADAFGVEIADLFPRSKPLLPWPDGSPEKNRRNPSVNDFRAAGEIQESCDRIEAFLEEAATITDADDQDKTRLSAALRVVRIVGNIAPAAAEKESARSLLIPIAKRFIEIGHELVDLAEKWDFPRSKTTEAQSSVTHIQQWTEDRAS